MKLLRSWPAVVPDGRCYVVDTLPRLVMDTYDYRCLGDVDDDVLLLEWDIAVGKEDLRRFIEAACADPGRVLVAPYRLYTTTAGNKPLQRQVWAHRRYGDEYKATTKHVSEEEDRSCHLFGLGLVYLPRSIVRAYLDQWPGHFNDGSFSAWHYENVTRETPIAWDVRPVHLHYPIDKTEMP